MARQKFNLPVHGFTEGLNTEATVLTVLPNEWMDGTVNVELLQNGAARRRRGADFINSNGLVTYRTATKTSEGTLECITGLEAHFTAPNGDHIERFIVDMDGEWRIFNNTLEGVESIDSPLQTISQSGHIGTLHKFYQVDFGISARRLYFAGKYIHPGYFYVDTDNTSLAITYFPVVIRDINATAVNSRVTRNSKWFECIQAHTSTTALRPDDGTGDWQQYWIQGQGRAPTGLSAWANSTSYTTSMIMQYDPYTAPAVGDTYPTSVEFFAGRVWLWGDPKNPTTGYFSQVIVDDSDIYRFHQAADPFDTNDSDLVDDDGGYLTIEGSGSIKKAVSNGSQLYVGTDQNVWSISGPDGVFKATNYTVRNVLNEAVPGAGSMIRMGGDVILFGESGIWRTTTEKTIFNTEQTEFENLSDNRVETLYGRVSERAKMAARAVYSPSERRVYYFYNESLGTTFLNHNMYDEPSIFTDCLIMDARFHNDSSTSANDPANRSQQSRARRTGAFFKYSFSDTADSDGIYIGGAFVGNFISANNNIVVDSSGDVVVDASSNNVVAAGDNGEYVGKEVFLIALQRLSAGANYSLKGAFCKLNGGYVGYDWYSDATYRVTYSSPLYCGVQSGGDISQKYSPTYLHFVFKKVEDMALDGDGIDTNPGGCFVRTAMDWAVNSNSNKWSSQQQIYVPYRYNISGDALDDGHSHTWYKHRVRGRGRSMQVILESDGVKDYHLVGWQQQFSKTNA